MRAEILLVPGRQAGGHLMCGAWIKLDLVLKSAGGEPTYFYLFALDGILFENFGDAFIDRL